MKEKSNNPSIEPELEARIVALVLGEASDFERDELNRLIDQRPELATLKEQMQSVHGLLLDVGAGESVAEDEDWKLSADSRSAVLAVISGETKEQPAKQVVSKSVEKRRSVKQNFTWSFAKVAAVLCVVGFFGSMAMPRINRARTSGLAYNLESAANSSDTSESLFGEASAPSSEFLMMDSAKSTADDEEPVEPSGVADHYFEKSSKSALSAIRDNFDVDATLPSPYFLQDDVQYYPAGPEFKLPQEAAALREARAAEQQNRASTKGVNGPQPPQQTADNRALAAQDGGIGGGGAGGGGFDVDATVPADGQRKGIAVENKREESSGEFGAWFSTDESEETPPSQPMDAEIGGRDGKAQQLPNAKEGLSTVLGFDGINGLPAPDLDVRFHRESFGLAPPLDAKELSKESVTMPSADDFALDNSRVLDGGEFDSRQIPEPVAGTAIGQPRGELEVGQAKQDAGGRYARNSERDFRQRWEATDQPARTTRGDVAHEIEKRVTDSLGELSALNELYKNTDIAGDSLPGDDKDVGQYWAKGQDHWQDYVPPKLVDSSDSMKKKIPNFAKIAGDVITRDSISGRQFTEERKKSSAPAGLNEKTAGDEAFSTFSLHVSDVSFKLAQAALAQGEWPDAAKVRIEEFVNAFDYGDPMPSQSEKVACHVEQSVHPFLQQRNLLRVSMRTAAAGRSSNTPLRLTFLLDNSGSMERIDRQQTVRRAFALLAQQLRPIDQVTLISFARQPRLLADKVSGSQSGQLVQLIDDLPSEGGTNIEAALQLAFEKAREQQVDGAQNRIILLTDGAVNLGDANPESLSRMITTMRGAGIAFDAAGISAEGLNDEILEALTRKGDGRYYLLDSLESADDGFARQIAGALRPSAKNVKVQVEFNPKRVGRYKLLGFEKHRLKQEDFRNDTVDAAEMAAAEAGVAVYQFEAKPDGQGDVGSVSVRFRDLSTGQMIENCWPIPYEANASRLDQSAPSLRIATSAALLAAKLRGEPQGESVDLKTLSNLISGLPDRDRNAKRVRQLHMMIEQARQVSGK